VETIFEWEFPVASHLVDLERIDRELNSIPAIRAKRYLEELEKRAPLVYGRLKAWALKNNRLTWHKWKKKGIGEMKTDRPMNQLETIVKETGLEKSKADIILAEFQDYFKVAAEWEIKAKTLIVTSEDQVAEMKMARTGRLFLRQKRITVENTRKKLKAESVREGKAIDGIANVLKALIVPIEEHLDKQEKYAINKAAEREELERLAKEREEKRIADEEAKKLEKERLEKEKAEAEEQERIRLENTLLRKEAEKHDEAMNKERKDAGARLKTYSAKLETETKKREDAELDRIAECLKVKHERQRVEGLEKVFEKLIECPFCHNKFNLPKE